MEAPVTHMRCGLTAHDDTYAYVPYLDEHFPPTMTIAEFLRVMAEDHAQTCECSVRVGSEAWLLNKRVGTFQPTPHPVNLDCTLGEFILGLDWGAVHLVVKGHPVGRSLLSVHPPNVLPRCEVVERNDAAAFKLAGRKVIVPDNKCTDYAKMCRTEGLVMVDKTRFVLPQFSQPKHNRLAIFRRPAGFGKTTLLSILTTYFDVLCPPAYYASMDCDTIPPHLAYLDAAARMLVLHMDFADLHFDHAMSVENMYKECHRFLAAVGAKFFGRYANFLGDAVPAKAERRDYYAAIVVAYNSGYEVFLAIDNYTAPFECGLTAWEGVFGIHVMQLILRDFAHGRIHRGFITGTDFEYTPFADWESFAESTLDLTHGSELATACGLTSEEVQALGAAAGIDDLLDAVHIASKSETRETPVVAGSTQPVFCTRDILALARRRIDLQLDQTSVPMAVAVIDVPVPVQDTVDSDDSDHGDSDHTLVDDEVQQSLKSTDDAWSLGGLPFTPAGKAAGIQPVEMYDDEEFGYVPF